MVTQAQGDRKLAPRRARGQGGFTLLEAVVSLGLVSTVVLTLAGGLLTTVKSSTAAKSTQQVDAALSAYAESFKGVAFDPTWDACPSTDQVYGAGTAPSWFTPPDVGPFGVTETEGWNGDVSRWQECASYTGSDDPGAVRLTVEVTVQTTHGQRTSTGQVVVRRDL